LSTPPPEAAVEYPTLDRSKLSGTPPYPKQSDLNLQALLRSARDIAPPTALLPDTFAARLYAMLEPLAQLDADAGWSLLILINAIGGMFQEVETWVRDTPDGPGWSPLLDLTRCPSEALPWLAQFAGVRIPGGLTDAEQRAWIASTSGFWRGTTSALIGAAKATLTGTQTVLFRERYGGPVTSPEYAYYLTVNTYTSETPDAAATKAALLSQKPAGIVLVYATVAASSYSAVSLSYATYTALGAAFPTYGALAAS
jgi:hypothetical protein